MRIKVSHFLQEPSHCAVAACAVTANYYDKNVNYEYTKDMAHKKVSKKISDEGLDSGQICLLLNYLGFNKVTLVSSILSVWDYSWAKFGKRKMKESLEKCTKEKKDCIDRDLSKSMLKWYSQKGYDNNVKIDYDFSKYIKKYLNRKKPIIVSFNWTMYMKFAKDGENMDDPINGEDQEHAVVLNGYDDNGIWIVDSHHQFYKYNRKKYRRGFYKMKWEHFLSCMGQGDVIFPENYN
jgi:hypothetical protein